MTMTTKAGGPEGLAPVLAALATMQGNASRTEKGQAHQFLEQFQKSVKLQWSCAKKCIDKVLE